MDSKLRKCTLFADLGDEAIAMLEEVARERQFPAGATIIDKNDVGTSMFVVCEGRVQILLPGENRQDVELDTLGSGHFFGEMALFDGKPRSAIARAVTYTQVIELAREPFLRQVRDKPELALRLLGVMAERIRQSDDQVGTLAERVVMAAAPRVDDVIGARLDAAKLIYEKTEDNVNRVLSHVDRTWTMLVRAGTLALVVASTVGLVFGAFGIYKFNDISNKMDLELKRSSENSDKVAENLQEAEALKARIDKIREAADDGTGALAIALHTDRIRRTMALGEDRFEDLSTQQRSLMFDDAEAQLLALLHIDEAGDSSPTETPLPLVVVEAADVYLRLFDKTSAGPPAATRDKIITLLLAAVEQLPGREWRIRQKARSVLLDYARLAPNAVIARTHGRFERVDSDRARVYLAELLFDLDAVNEEVRTVLQNSMTQNESPWGRVLAALRLARTGDAQAWNRLMRNLAGAERDAYVTAYLLANDRDIGPFASDVVGDGELQQLQARETICARARAAGIVDPYRLIHDHLDARIEETVNPYWLAHTEGVLQALKELSDSRACSA